MLWGEVESRVTSCGGPSGAVRKPPFTIMAICLIVEKTAQQGQANSTRWWCWDKNVPAEHLGSSCLLICLKGVTLYLTSIENKTLNFIQFPLYSVRDYTRASSLHFDQECYIFSCFNVLKEGITGNAEDLNTRPFKTQQWNDLFFNLWQIMASLNITTDVQDGKTLERFF